MKTRLELAHEYAMAYITESLKVDLDFDFNHQLISLDAFSYADAMLAENELTTLQQTFINGVEQPRYTPCVEEWQPDWGQAPDGRIQYFAVDENGRGGWYINKPVLCYDHWYWSDFEERMGNDCYDYAPSFNYQGDWRDSLRKRPEGK